MTKLEKELINNIADCAHVWNDALEVDRIAWDAWAAYKDAYNALEADRDARDAWAAYSDAMDAAVDAKTALDKSLEVYNEHKRVEV